MKRKSMTRQLEPIDLMVAVGLFATVLGGLGLFAVTNGGMEAGLSGAWGVERSAGEAGQVDPMQWVQPALGAAIVNVSRLEREAYQEMVAASADLQRARVVDVYLQSAPSDYIGRIGAYARLAEADHAARLQFVMGRRIVDTTARGMRAGVYQLPMLGERHNRRMIRTTELSAIRLDEQYRSAHEPLLGAEIVAATQARRQMEGRIQQRLGQAIVRMVKREEDYREALAGAQEQLATLVLASMHQELIADRFARLAAADAEPVSQAAVVAGPRSWPEIPMGIMVASFFGLIGIFCIGLSTPSDRRRAIPPDAATEPAAVSRKTAA
ncbi:MAG: hypothetical protein EPO61_07120 [Nitrospirae bacterium]|nr:MAG: hypothetical protein EPO61_07120 [Nitrospirota bacterium]